MNTQARTRLAAAARRYFAAAPWKVVGDDYLFGLHDRTGGLFGCAAVMGAAGLEFGLDVSLGARGFALLQKLQDDEMDHSTMRAKASSVALTITNAAPASRSFKRLEPLMVDKGKLTEPARGYMTGWRLVPGQDPRPLDSEEAVFLARCLEAVAELTENGRLGADERRDGARTLFFNLTEEQGGLTIRRSYRRLDEVDVQHPKVTLPAELLGRLRERPRIDGRYLVSIFSPPATVQGGIVWTALLLDEEGRPALAHCAHDVEGAARAVFGAFAGETSVKGAKLGVPREVWTDAFPIYEALKDAMLELGVRFLSREDVPELRAAKESLGAFLTGGA